MINSSEFTIHSGAGVIDEGLKNFMLKIYNYMAGGLTVTALSAYLVATNPSLLRIFFLPTGQMSGLGWLALFAPLIMIFTFGWVLQRGTLQQVKTMFWSYSAVMGISLAPVFLVYTGASIARIFLITAATFGSLSLYGYTTKKDLTPMGGFLMMSIFGLIIASIANIFIRSTGFDFVLSLLSVLIFAGLTAFDTQKLKSLYYANDINNDDNTSRGAIAGALSLYLDFINMFMALLRLFGDRK